MMTKIEKLARDVRAEYGAFTSRAIQRLRAATLDTAGVIDSSRKPVRKFTEAGLRINRISSKGVEKLVKQQATFVDSAIEGGAHRLELAARADSLRALVGDQISVLPKARHWAVLNARKTIEIVKDTGDEIGDVLRTTVAAPKPARKPVARKTTRKAKGKTRRTAAKKTSARKAPGRKPAAKKRVRKAASKAKAAPKTAAA
jgi:phasin family protein